MADFLDEKRKEIDSRLRELRPLVDEYNRLEKAAAALRGSGAATTNGSSAAPRRRRGYGLSCGPQGPLAAVRAAAGHAPSRRSSWCGRAPG